MPLSDAQVIAAVGDPTPYVRPDGSIDDAWATAQLATCELPAPLALSWAPAQLVSRLKVHRRLVGAYTAALGTVRANPDAWAALHSTGGAYCWRPQRQSAGRKLSRHCWGIAIDLDVELRVIFLARDLKVGEQRAPFCVAQRAELLQDLFGEAAPVAEVVAEDLDVDRRRRTKVQDALDDTAGGEEDLRARERVARSLAELVRRAHVRDRAFGFRR